MDYKDTLNLPKTDFPMKANLSQREPLILQQWEETHIYRKMVEQARDRPSYILHDGPPYANGHIHLGHVINKVLKDIIVKAKFLSGHLSEYVPGWDCHGLPIEHQVDKDLGKKKHSLSLMEVRQACRRYAEKFIDIQREEFKRLGIFGEWDNPYITMTYPYEARIARELGAFVGKGSVYRGKKPVHWCSSCRTALAEAEVEYDMHTSPSIYVAFPLISSLDKIFPEAVNKPAAVVIWTTTPWTIPANLAIAVHPEYDYVAAEVDGKILIMAERLLVPTLEVLGSTEKRILGRCQGTRLDGLRCRHPIYDRESILILGNHVTLDAGTGCVHTAPGHGQEDYEIGLEYGLEVYAPVDDKGCFTQEAEFFEGQFVFKANPAVNEKLRAKNALLHEESVTHSYPHCWRCKKPVIFRSTEQWFISMDKTGLRQNALESIDQVSWIPPWGKERIRGMVENRPDWCISRQRVWGVPIIAFSCKECGEKIIEKQLIDHVSNHFEKEGADVWFAKSADELLPEGYSCPQCQKASFEKEYNILDVWFDSGVSFSAVLEARDNLSTPADLYLEGSDQHRGWFQSALLTSVGTRGSAPFRAVLTHGFTVDGKGKKMSKSQGNIIAPEKVIKRGGAEILRLWAAAEDYRDDIRISDEILARLTEAYRRIRNTCRFMLGNLSDFDPSSQMCQDSDLLEIDRWALSAFAKLVERTTRAYEEFEFHIVYHALNNFCTVELSSLYLDILKDRLYTWAPDHPGRKAAQTVLYRILTSMLSVMAPILSFLAEETWGYLPPDPQRPESVFLTTFPDLENWTLDQETSERWETLLAVRQDVSKALELARVEKLIGHSLDAKVYLAIPGELFDKLKPLESELPFLFIVSQVELNKAGDDGPAPSAPPAYESEALPGVKIRVTPAEGKKCERCWNYSVHVGVNSEHPTACERCVQAL